METTFPTLHGTKEQFCASCHEQKTLFKHYTESGENLPLCIDCLYKVEEVPEYFDNWINRKPSTLICYAGGGYEGCFWEWNFAFIDNEGKFHFIFKSGRNGCESLLEFETKILANERAYELFKEDELELFGEEYNEGFVLRVGAWLWENHAIDFNVKCDKCGCMISVVDMENTWYCGNGGIGVDYHGFICSDCKDTEEIEEERASNKEKVGIAFAALEELLEEKELALKKLRVKLCSLSAEKLNTQYDRIEEMAEFLYKITTLLEEAKEEVNEIIDSI